MPPPMLTVGQRVCKCKGVSKEILRGSQNFEIGSRAASDAQFRANLLSGGKNCPRPMCVPNLKGVALSVCEILAHLAAVH